jgi:PAS domain S-box-containing protein
MIKNNLKNLLPLISLVVIFLIDLSIIFTTHQNWNTSMNKYLPLKSAIQTVRNDITTAHLWFEESISGDKYVDIQTDVIDKLKVKEYKKYINNVKNILKEGEDLDFYYNLILLDKEMTIFYNLAQKRLVDVLEHKIGSDLDQTFDRQFNKITTEILKLDLRVNKKLEEEFMDKKNYFIIVLSLFLIVNILAFIFLFRFRIETNKYEKKLYNEREKAFVTLNSIGDAVITTDAKGYVTFLNPVAEELTAYKNEEAIGKYLDDVFSIMNEETKEKIDSPVKKVLKEGRIIGLANHTALISKNNDVYSIEDSASPIREKNGKLIGTILVFHDVTAQKQVREKLSENEKILIQQSKMAAMGEMLENIAHQWRQPLSIISTSATGIKVKKEINDLDDKFLMDSVNLINNSTQHLSKTIEDFREFFKPNRKKEEFDLSDVYYRTLLLISSKLNHKDIKLVENISSIKISGFENELVQVLMNLINNSIDALERKKGSKVVFINIYEKENKAYLQFYDNAGGILKEIISRVFEPYFTTKNQSQGTGIGLYMAEEIITKHMNGKIDVQNVTFEYENETYIGAEFTIQLSRVNY